VLNAPPMTSIVTTGNANTNVSTSGSRVISFRSVRTSRPTAGAHRRPPTSCYQNRRAHGRLALEQPSKASPRSGPERPSPLTPIRTAQCRADVGDDAPAAMHRDLRACELHIPQAAGRRPQSWRPAGALRIPPSAVRAYPRHGPAEYRGPRSGPSEAAFAQAPAARPHPAAARKAESALHRRQAPLG
jgi:hypothetical protein